MQFRWFALTHFFGLHIGRLINLKIVSATFGIGGAIAPIAPPLATDQNTCYLLQL